MAQSACLMPSPGDAFRMLTVTTLNFTTMNDAFEQGKHAFVTHDYHQAVEHYTSALRALQQDLSAVILVHRAAAYEMQGKYESAVDDGQAANPYGSATRADPYLTLGNALFLNNQLRESAAVYKHGAEIVPETCSRHDVLVTKHHQAQNAMEKQNQFICRLLPFEVLSRILSMLSIKDRVTLAITCRFWNNYIFKKWPYMWETIDTRTDLPDYPQKGAGLIEAIHGDQVRNLTVEFEDPLLRYFFENSGDSDSDDISDDGRSRNAGVAILNAMSGIFPWKHIRHLSLTDCNEVYFEEISNVVKDSLLELTFHDNNKHNNYAKAMIIKAADTFPNLQVISSYLITEDPSFRLMDYLNDTARLSNFRLTSLSMAWKLETSSFTRICEFLPSLTSLVIDPEVYYDYVNILDATTKHCPALEVLRYKRDSVKQPLCTTYTPESPVSTDNGLKVLVLHPVTKWGYVKDADRLLTLLLQRGSRKLETLDIDLGVIEGTEFTSIETLTQFGAPSLQTLNIYAWNDSSLGPEMLANLISSCPSLTNITISGLNVGYINRTLNALEGSVSIRLLKMFFHHYRYLPITINEGVVSISNITSFFKRTRHIYDFSLNCSGSHCNLTSKSWFILGLTQAISFSTVQMLDLRTHILKDDVLLGVLNNLKDSQVQTLKIQVTSEIGDLELDAFAEIQHLTHLIVYDGQFRFKEVHICRLLEKWQKSQMLVVEVRCNNSRHFIKGYKPDLATTRPVRDQIDDLKQRYSIQSLCAEFPFCNQQKCVKTHQRCNQFYGSC